MFCREIDGDLTFDPNAGTTVLSTAFPYLVRVRGSVLSTLSTAMPTAWSVTLSALQTIDGDVEFSWLGGLSALSMPRLMHVGGDISIGLTSLTRLSLPQLTSVDGSFALVGLSGLTQLDLGKLDAIGGTLALSRLCRLPWVQLDHVGTLGMGQTIADIGCCNTLGRYNCSTGCICDCDATICSYAITAFRQQPFRT